MSDHLSSTMDVLLLTRRRFVADYYYIIIIFRDHFTKIDWIVKHEISILKVQILADFSMKKKRKKDIFYEKLVFLNINIMLSFPRCVTIIFHRHLLLSQLVV